jgi:HSP20 family molecular chaperone IbpA
MRKKEAGIMASSFSEHSRQYHMDKGYPESKFSRSPWERIEHRALNQAPVTVWVGISSVIVAISIPDIDPDDLDVSVLGTRLSFRATAHSRHFSQDVDLPCTVEAHPIRVKGDRGVQYILLVKKQGADTVTAEGYGDRHPSSPALTMSGA